MELLPESLKEKIPTLYSTESLSDPTIWVKYFHRSSNWTWYVQEYDPENRLFFGLVCGFEKELGYFSLDELLSVSEIERDLYFTPKPLSDVKKEVGY